MSRLSRDHRVFYLEEPVFRDIDIPSYNSCKDLQSNVYVITPYLPHGLDQRQIIDQQKRLLDELIASFQMKSLVLWYYTPMAWPFSDHLSAICRVYDCMDELSAFKFAPPELKANERTLFQMADIVFTGGQSLYLAKKTSHHDIHAFPSSIDGDHFIKARQPHADPDDQRFVPHPRFGFYGVIDERLDISMLGQIAALRPDWHFIMIGPIVKIDPGYLPAWDNIHYLGRKDYSDLPSYLGGWDVAIMPFALNESTRFISPTKTPEYLAGGKPVISSSIRDVVDPYAAHGLVSIADTPEQFIQAAADILEKGIREEWLKKVDQFLAGRSWERTVSEMSALMQARIKQKMTLKNKHNIHV